MCPDEIINTDVLVIGGGMAGMFAAIKARGEGMEVTLVDKGYAGKSGQTVFACVHRVFNSDWGDRLDDWVAEASKLGEYVNNRDWTEIIFNESYNRYLDLVAWGVKFREEEQTFTKSPKMPRARNTKQMEWKVFGDVLRKQVLKHGVKIIDRCMVTDLLKQDGSIVGAIGIPMESYDKYVFKAKATVLCSGAGGHKPWGSGISALTSDGDAMAYRAGAEIIGKEFPDTRPIPAETPAYFGFSQALAGGPSWVRGKLINAEDNDIWNANAPISFIQFEFEVHAGRAPIYRVPPDGKRVRIVGSATGMSQHTAEGIWPSGTDCATSLPGLYAAGDNLGNMPTGGVYYGGTGLVNASVTGAIAGVAAAKYAKSSEEPEIDKREITQVKKIIQEPVERKGGFSPRWVTQLLQNTMMPYFVHIIKREDRLKAALTNVEFYRDHLVPRLFARDSHELRLAIETKNMLLNAEMRLRASLFRRESRGCHYREDYPRRDDPNWLAWVLLKDENGEMKTIKKPVPRKWWPDLTKPYNERYPARFPGE